MGILEHHTRFHLLRLAVRLTQRRTYAMRLNGFTSSLRYTFPECVALMRRMPYKPKSNYNEKVKIEVLFDDVVIYTDIRS